MQSAVISRAMPHFAQRYRSPFFGWPTPLSSPCPGFAVVAAIARSSPPSLFGRQIRAAKSVPQGRGALQYDRAVPELAAIVAGVAGTRPAFLMVRSIRATQKRWRLARSANDIKSLTRRHITPGRPFAVG